MREYPKRCEIYLGVVGILYRPQINFFIKGNNALRDESDSKLPFVLYLIHASFSGVILNLSFGQVVLFLRKNLSQLLINK